MAQGDNKEAGDTKHAGPQPQGDSQQTAGHTSALHAEAYNPPLNYRATSGDDKAKPAECTKGPSIYALSIDTTPGNIVIHDVPRRDDTPAEQREAKKREMPVSNPHFRDLVVGGVGAIPDSGGFNIQMRNVLYEANRSDHTMKTGHDHVDDVLKYANAHLCGTDYTLRRQDNIVEIYDSSHSTKHPESKWDLDKNKYVR
jgi:hypothetical protein